MTPLLVDTAQFLASDCTILDVRSPGEFRQGHIPGALSFPLFSDEERAAVGTVYKQAGKEPAIELGLELVGPKMADFVKTAKRIAPNRHLAVHCWRGGKRSQSMAWLLQLNGFEVATLDGGYKQYRRHVLQYFEHIAFADLRVVGGKTGTGKTKTLHELRKKGHQIIDLEGIAHHKGSAFGTIGEQPQPTVEQFENDLFQAIQTLDLTKPIWIENESRSIGRVYIPDGLWNTLKTAPLYNIEIPHADRIANLLTDYVLTDPSELEAAFRRIEKKLGGQHLKTALESLHKGDYRTAAEIATQYYDKTYQHCLLTNVPVKLIPLAFDHGDPTKIAQCLINAEK
jgi:tRNA 2-selenouridine synthase